MTRFFRDYLLAVGYFTRIPVTGALAEWAGPTPNRLRASAAHFPGVGLFVGLVACVTFALVSLLLPDTPMTPVVAAFGCIVATAWLTGAAHESGLACFADLHRDSASAERHGASNESARARSDLDSARSEPDAARAELDRAGAEWGRASPVQDAASAEERAVADVAVAARAVGTGPVGLGAHGALALLLAVGMKVSLLAVIARVSPAAVLAALLAAHTVSRFCVLWVARLPRVGLIDFADARPAIEPIGGSLVKFAVAWCVPPLLVMLAVGRIGFVAVAVLAAAAMLWSARRMLVRKLGGCSANALDAVQQACEVAFYLGAAIGAGAAIGIGGGR